MTTQDKPINDLNSVELKAEVERLLHLLWGHCQASPDYDKPSWGRFQLCLHKLTADPPLRLRPVPPREFVAAWQQAVFLEDVSERLSQPVLTLAVKATRYRQKGVELKPLVSRYYGTSTGGDGGNIDWDALETLAKELNP